MTNIEEFGYINDTLGQIRRLKIPSFEFRGVKIPGVDFSNASPENIRSKLAELERVKGLFNGAENTFNGIKNGVQSAIDALQGGQVGDTITDWANQAGNALAPVGDAFSDAGKAFSNAFSSVAGFFGGKQKKKNCNPLCYAPQIYLDLGRRRFVMTKIHFHHGADCNWPNDYRFEERDGNTRLHMIHRNGCKAQTDILYSNNVRIYTNEHEDVFDGIIISPRDKTSDAMQQLSNHEINILKKLFGNEKVVGRKYTAGKTFLLICLLNQIVLHQRYAHDNSVIKQLRRGGKFENNVKAWMANFCKFMMQTFSDDNWDVNHLERYYSSYKDMTKKQDSYSKRQDSIKEQIIELSNELVSLPGKKKSEAKNNLLVRDKMKKQQIARFNIEKKNIEDTIKNTTSLKNIPYEHTIVLKKINNHPIVNMDNDTGFFLYKKRTMKFRIFTDRKPINSYQNQVYAEEIRKTFKVVIGHERREFNVEIRETHRSRKSGSKWKRMINIRVEVNGDKERTFNLPIGTVEYFLSFHQRNDRYGRMILRGVSRPDLAFGNEEYFELLDKNYPGNIIGDKVELKMHNIPNSKVFLTFSDPAVNSSVLQKLIEKKKEVVQIHEEEMRRIDKRYASNMYKAENMHEQIKLAIQDLKKQMESITSEKQMAWINMGASFCSDWRFRRIGDWNNAELFNKMLRITKSGYTSVHHDGYGYNNILRTSTGRIEERPPKPVITKELASNNTFQLTGLAGG